MTSHCLSPEESQKYKNLEYRFPERSLQGKVVLVSGGTGGLGAALVARLLLEQVIPVVGYRSNHERANHVKGKLESLYGGTVYLVDGDIRCATDRKKVIEIASRVTGTIEGFVCFAGDPGRIPFEDLRAEDLVKSYENNFIGPILLAKEVGEQMIACKVQGSLVLISSMQGVGLFERSLNYAAPKASLIHACRILAKQWGGKQKLRINVVAPGATVVGMAESSVRSGKYDGYIERQVIPRFGRPEDVAKAVRFLLEPDSYVNGQVILVDGGLCLQA